VLEAHRQRLLLELRKALGRDEAQHRQMVLRRLQI